MQVTVLDPGTAPAAPVTLVSPELARATAISWPRGGASFRSPRTVQATSARKRNCLLMERPPVDAGRLSHRSPPRRSRRLRRHLQLLALNGDPTRKVFL